VKNSVFEYGGDLGKLVECFYKLLMSRNVVTYRDVLVMYDDGNLDLKENQVISGHKQYGTLKKVVPQVIKEMEESGCEVLTIREGQSTSYQYVGASPNPLKNVKFRAQILKKYGELSSWIKQKKVLQIRYKPFGSLEREGKEMRIIFHPQLLYMYNNRYFVFGVKEWKGKKYKQNCLALDRIIGNIKPANGIDYISSEPDEYRFLANIIGVTIESRVNMEPKPIRIRALDQYTFGRITTKPLHDSQRTIIKPNREKGREYGEVEIFVIPNKELIGQIISYESNIIVVSPPNIRDRVSQEIRQMAKLYSYDI